MNRLNRTKRGKTILAAALTLACFVGALCCGAILGAFGYECYDSGVESYYDTMDFQQIVQRNANDIIGSFVQDGLKSEAKQYEADQTNLRFRITGIYPDDCAGIEYYSTMDDTKTRNAVWYGFVAQPDGVHYDASVLGFGDWDESAEERMAKAFLQQQQAADEHATVYLLQLAVTDPIRVDGYFSYGLYDDFTVFNLLYPLRYPAIVLLAVCAVVALVSLILLLAGAGRLAGRDEVVFTWFDRIPMELSFAMLVTLGILAALLVWEGIPKLVNDAFYWVELPYRMVCITAVCGLALVFTEWVMSAVAWLMALVRAAKSGSIFRNFGCARFFGWVLGAAKRLPLVPRVATAAAVFAGLNAVAALAVYSDSYIRLSSISILLLLLLALVWLAAAAELINLAVSMKKLDEAARRIAAGDYTTAVDARRMPAPLREHAQTLENIAAGLNVAVEQRIRSERLKTELITNVSHDLKTPLTSMINYTDLLQSQPLPPKAAEYAQVLARQADRLKKLTEDLVEASKASSGAMPCEKRPTDLAELCGQALGEYAARLEAAGLTPVLTMPETGLWANADGRLVWRILDNLLGNACKYAQPGTRLYLDGRACGDAAVIGLKNISREPLNISADELMERFVRGDSSRSTEGSGLGLSIARSLCELQGGSFGLTIDGDLFKAELRLEPCDPPAPELPEAAPSGTRE